jgi:hypothetical protein
MNFAGCDLHKESITIRVVNQSRQVLCRRRLVCRDEQALRSFFDSLALLSPPKIKERDEREIPQAASRASVPLRDNCIACGRPSGAVPRKDSPQGHPQFDLRACLG